MAQRKGTILISDDEKALRKLLHQKLKGEGYHCEEAENGEDILTYLEDNATDLVLLDINMPGKSGTELLPEIREHYRDVAVIVTTGTGDIDTAIGATRLGAYDYVKKPFKLDEVVHSVKRAIERRGLELELRDYQQHLEQRLEKQAKEIREAFLGTMAALSFALEAKDIYTTGHSSRVSEIALAIGKKLILADDELEDLRWGCLIHDIGKIAVDPLIVNKAGKLTAEEYEHVMTHPIVGANIVGQAVKNKRIIEVIKYHHAHYDGSGFKQELRGKDIPLLARIAAVADAYDAMTSTRPHRAAWTRDQALAEIRWAVGKQFDPLAANTFLEMAAADIMPEKKKILIADDKESIRLLVGSILNDNYTVIAAVDGQEAIEAAQQQELALILTDTFMPRKDGFQVCYEVKNNLATMAIPVVMITDTNHDMERKLGAKLGADGYITKPFSAETLLETVNHFLANDAREKHEASSVAANDLAP